MQQIESSSTTDAQSLLASPLYSEACTPTAGSDTLLALAAVQSRPNCNAILLTTEITTPAYYKGKDKHRQVTNMIFRTGASAVLFSNKPKMVAKAKYKLATNYRVHLASRDPAYKCIWYGPDAEGNNGIYLGKDVVNEASRALR